MGPTYSQAPPAYILAEHSEMLSGDIRGIDWGTPHTNVPELTEGTGYNPFNLKALMYQTYLAGSPYAGVAAYDPSEDLADTETALDEWLDELDDWNPATDWTAAATAVGSKADTLFTDSSVVAAEVAAHTARTADRYAQGVAQALSGKFMGNSAEGAQTSIAVAMLAAARGYELEDYEQQFVQSQRRERASFIDEHTKVYLNNVNAKRSLVRDKYALKADLSTRKVVAGKEFVQEELQYALKDSTFALDLFAHGGSMIGAISGAPNLVPAPSKQQTALSVLLGVLPAVISIL